MRSRGVNTTALIPRALRPEPRGGELERQHVLAVASAPDCWPRAFAGKLTCWRLTPFLSPSSGLTASSVRREVNVLAPDPFFTAESRSSTPDSLVGVCDGST